MKTDADPFAGLRPAGPPAGLRPRVLAAALDARAAALASRHWIDRLWESRALRLAWALALALALAGHLAVGLAARRAALRYELVPPTEPLPAGAARIPPELEEAP